MASKNKISVTVVVSGSPQELSINLHQEVEKLVKEALKEAKVHHPDLSEWSLRAKSGGTPIPQNSTIEAAGIKDGETLFLDPDEGGGGEVAVAPSLQGAAEPPAPPLLVDPEVSKAKAARQLGEWEANERAYRERGWFLLDRGELHAEVGFTCRLPIGQFGDVVAMPIAIRVDFHNYDVWAPSVQLIDPLEGRWLEQPRLGAIDFNRLDPAGNPEQSFIIHPDTHKVFLCKRGVREYHQHFEHTGDDWLLYRDHGLGTLAQICDVIWRLTTRNVTGLNFVAQRVPVGDQAMVTRAIEIRQEDVDQLEAAIQPQVVQPQQIQLNPDQLPPEIRAQIEAALPQNQG